MISLSLIIHCANLYHFILHCFIDLLSLFLSVFNSCLCVSAGNSLNKHHRRVASKKDYSDFPTFLSAALDRTQLAEAEDLERVKSDLLKLHEEYEQYFELIEPFTVCVVLEDSFIFEVSQLKT